MAQFAVCLVLSEFTSLLMICLMYRTAWDNNFWLQLDYLQLAAAALNVSLYFTCLLYIEIWAEITRFVSAVYSDFLIIHVVTLECVK